MSGTVSTTTTESSESSQPQAPPVRLPFSQDKLTPEMVELLGNHYGKRAFQAVDAVRRGMVKRYNDFWVVEGKSDKYIVEIDGDDGFCLCKDWLIRRSAKGDICYHMLAARIAEETGMFVRVEEWCIDTVLKDY